jgi:spore photoproduct lyase
MFKHAYESFNAWQDKSNEDVFFYLCMEEHHMWQKTFGYQYSTNNDFEQAMLSAYAKKLGMEYLV